MCGVNGAILVAVWEPGARSIPTAATAARRTLPTACLHVRLHPTARYSPPAARRPCRRGPKARRLSEYVSRTGRRLGRARRRERRSAGSCAGFCTPAVPNCWRCTCSVPAACLLRALVARGSHARLTPRDGMCLCRMCLCRMCLCLSVGGSCMYFCALKMPCVTHACSQDALLFPLPHTHQVTYVGLTLLSLTHSLPYCDVCAGAGGPARVLMRYKREHHSERDVSPVSLPLARSPLPPPVQSLAVPLLLQRPGGAPPSCCGACGRVLRMGVVRGAGPRRGPIWRRG